MDSGTEIEEAQKQRVARKRIAIAAEALSSASDVKIPNIPKTEAVLRVLGIALSRLFPSHPYSFFLWIACPEKKAASHYDGLLFL